MLAFEEAKAASPVRRERRTNLEKRIHDAAPWL